MEYLYVAERLHYAQVAARADRAARYEAVAQRRRRERFDARLGLLAHLLLLFRAG